MTLPAYGIICVRKVSGTVRRPLYRVRWVK